MPPTEKPYQRYAWVILFAFGLFGVFLALLPLVGGYLYLVSPGVIAQAVPASTASVTVTFLNGLARGEGLEELFSGVLIAGIAATGFRNGQRWAWYVTSWAFIITAGTATLGFFEPDMGTPLVGLVLAVVLAAGLFLPYRRFFPKKAAVR